MNSKAEGRVFSLRRLLSKRSLSDVFFRFSSRAEVRAEFAVFLSTCEKTQGDREEAFKSWGRGGGGGLGRKPESSELMWVKVRARAPRGTVNIVWDWDSCDQCPWGVTWQIPSVTAQTDYSYKPEERFLCALALLNIKEHWENSSRKQKCRDSGISSGKKKNKVKPTWNLSRFQIKFFFFFSPR